MTAAKCPRCKTVGGHTMLCPLRHAGTPTSAAYDHRLLYAGSADGQKLVNSAALAALVDAHDRYRQELMRCGSLAVSDRLDGCLPKGRTDQIRRIAYYTCWPEDVHPDAPDYARGEDGDYSG